MTRAPIVLALLACVAGAASPPQTTRGVVLGDLTWMEAEEALTADTVVVIPLGAAAKEHGPHLKLKNDLILSDYLTARVLERADVVVAPTIAYHFYPSFLEYPGSTHLQRDTARNLVVDIVRSLAGHGPKRFYVLNTGISTNLALAPATDVLRDHGILLRYTDLSALLDPVELQIGQQEGGSHADEIETSMLLYIDPASVDMSKAEKDYDASGRGPLSRVKGKPDTTYSPTGAWGDPTLATREKGRIAVEAWVAGVLREIEQTRVAPVPAARPARDRSRVAATFPRAPGMPPAPAAGSGGSAGDERDIRLLLDQFAVAWNNADSWGIASLWTADGTVAHVDGAVERGRQSINEARATMFSRREYRASRHLLFPGQITFVAPGVAATTGGYVLTGVMDAERHPQPDVIGPCAMVFRNVPGEGWRFAAFQYVEHARGAPAPLTKVPNAVVK